MTPKQAEIKISVTNLPPVRDLVERLELIAGIPDDADVRDATGLAKEALEGFYGAVREGGRPA